MQTVLDFQLGHTLQRIWKSFDTNIKYTFNCLGSKQEKKVSGNTMTFDPKTMVESFAHGGHMLDLTEDPIKDHFKQVFC